MHAASGYGKLLSFRDGGKIITHQFALLFMLTFTASSPDRIAPGTVVKLNGYHYWVADKQGVLHFAGDTHVLRQRRIAYWLPRHMNLAELLTYPIGDPWLSADLLQDGGHIYLVESSPVGGRPYTLLRIQSLQDLELMGINGTNYGRFVLDRQTWEHRYGMSVDWLERGRMIAAVPVVQPTATPGIRAWPTPIPRPPWPRPTVTSYRLHVPTPRAPWRPAPSPTPQWVQPAQQSSGTWVFQGKRLQIEVLSHGWRGDLLLVTVRLHNPQSEPFYPDNYSISLRWDGQVAHQTSPRHSCAGESYPNKLRDVIRERFLDPVMPGGETVTGNLCWKEIPASPRSLELVPQTAYNGLALRVS